MLKEYLASKTVQEAILIFKTEIPFALWETIYVTLISTALAIVIGLPLGILLVAGEEDGVLPLPKWLILWARL